jgi:hypothetical protein
MLAKIGGRFLVIPLELCRHTIMLLQNCTYEAGAHFD